MWRKNRRKKFIIVTATLIFASLTFWACHNLASEEKSTVDSTGEELPSHQLQQDDFDEENEQEEKLIFAELDEGKIPLNRGIFFFVSSGAIDLLPSEACSVEAVARLNPSRRVFVLFLRVEIGNVLNSKTLALLDSFPNVNLRFIRVSKYLDRFESLSKWFVESSFQTKPHMSEHLSHALAYTFLDKFGGVVTDFDFLAIQPVLEGDFLARCDDLHAESFPLSLSYGHPLAKLLANEFGKFYNADDPYSTGKELITRQLASECHVDVIKEMIYKDCPFGARVTSVSTFCPFEESKYWIAFDPKRSELVLKRLRDSNSNALRLWRNWSAGIKSWGGANATTAFYRLAEEKCPSALDATSDESFT